MNNITELVILFAHLSPAQIGLMDVSCYVRCSDLTDSKANKQTGRVGDASAGRLPKSLILWKLAERVGFESSL